MEAFDTMYTRMTATETARRTGLSVASARRCMLTLCDAGYMETDGKRFWLSHGVLRLAYAYSASTRLPRLIQPVLDALSERGRDSASLIVLFDDAPVIAARSTARRTLRVGLVVGSRLPTYCSAAGRVLLAALPAERANNILKRAIRTPLTLNTVTEMSDLKLLLKRCRSDGYAISDEEIELGVRSIAIPVLNAEGISIAAISMSTRADRMTITEMVETYLPALRTHQSWVQRRLSA
jgi:IclR family pca regulon transcriptional regulator